MSNMHQSPTLSPSAAQANNQQVYMYTQPQPSRKIKTLTVQNQQTSQYIKKGSQTSNNNQTQS